MCVYVCVCVCVCVPCLRWLSAVFISFPCVPSVVCVPFPLLSVDFTLDANGLLRADKAELLREVDEPEAADAAPAAADAPPKKKKFARVPLTVEAVFASGYTPAQVEGYIAREAAIAAQDAFLRETRDKRNELEAYIYDMRNKLQEGLAPYATEADKVPVCLCVCISLVARSLRVIVPLCCVPVCLRANVCNSVV